METPGSRQKMARAARTRRLRWRVVSGAVALFVATWLLITVTLASGHDPVLSSKTATTTATTATTATATTATTATTTSGSSGDSNSTNNSSSVSTRQS